MSRLLFLFVPLFCFFFTIQTEEKERIHAIMDKEVALDNEQLHQTEPEKINFSYHHPIPSFHRILSFYSKKEHHFHISPHIPISNAHFFSGIKQAEESNFQQKYYNYHPFLHEQGYYVYTLRKLLL